jgi:hypothetical protein
MKILLADGQHDAANGPKWTRKRQKLGENGGKMGKMSAK